MIAALRFLRVAVLLCLPVQALGRSIPPFDLDTNAGKAKIAALGELHSDGTLRVIELFKGKPGSAADLKLPINDRQYKSISKDLGVEGNPQVFVFLDELGADGVYRLTQGFVSLVAIGPGDRVFAWLSSQGSPSGAFFQAHPSWTKQSFIEALKDSLKVDAELGALLARPRSAERLRNCMQFLQKNQPWKTLAEYYWHLPLRFGHSYFFSKIASDTQKPSAAEELVLADLLRESASDEDRARVLAFIGRTKCSRALYSEVLPWVDLRIEKLPRVQAFHALASIDSTAAAEVLCRFLSLDDPQIDDVISTLSHCGWMREPRLLNPAVVEPMLNFAKQALIKSHSGNSQDGNRGYATLGVLQNYFHPAWLPLMFEWANDQGTFTQAQAMSNLRTALGVTNEPHDPERLGKWWNQNREVVQRHYDLESWSGVRQWLKAWRSTDDKITRHVLLRLWDFASSVPEHELLKDCEGDSGWAAKELLSELWQRKRLSVATRKAIVAAYVKMKIVELPNPFPKYPKWRELRIVGERTFPFPRDSWIHKTADLASGRIPEIRDPKSGSNFSLEGSGPRDFHSVGGSVEGHTTAVLEIWEMDYQATPPNELWRLHWVLDQESKQPVGPIPPK